MKRYDPLKATRSEKHGLAAPASRNAIDLVQDYHRREQITAAKMKTAHCGRPCCRREPDCAPVTNLPIERAPLHRLMAEGLDRHDAITTRSGSKVANVFHDILKNARSRTRIRIWPICASVEQLTA